MPSTSPTAASPAGRFPAGADAFVYAERGVYRSNETVYLTALLRDGQGNAPDRHAAYHGDRAA